MALNEKQQLFFDEVKRGGNLIISGPAGTGKSFCIKKLIEDLSNSGGIFGITATTGIAALSIGGSTLHSWCGIGLGEEDADFLMKRVRKMSTIRQRIQKTKVLVIDEVSMLSGELFDKIDYIFKKIRGNSRPFGGMQLIFSGDMLQLPPVSRGKTAKFVFESKAWKDANIKLVQLTEQIRQKGDDKFANILNEIRIGNAEAARELIDNQVVFPDDGIKPIVLYCLNKYVEQHNEEEMNKLPGTVKKYYSSTKGGEKDVNSLKNSCPALDILSLKISTQVILLKNIDPENGLVNGSLGVVVDLLPDSVRVKFETGTYDIPRADWELKKQSIQDGSTKFKVAASLNQIPLKLAYSLSVHKSQGLTLDRVIMDATGVFEDGLVYVGLSRVRDSKHLIIKNLNINKITANAKALAFYGYQPKNELDENPFDW